MNDCPQSQINKTEGIHRVWGIHEIILVFVNTTQWTLRYGIFANAPSDTWCYGHSETVGCSRIPPLSPETVWCSETWACLQWLGTFNNTHSLILDLRESIDSPSLNWDWQVFRDRRDLWMPKTHLRLRSIQTKGGFMKILSLILATCYCPSPVHKRNKLLHTSLWNSDQWHLQIPPSLTLECDRFIYIGNICGHPKSHLSHVLPVQIQVWK